MENSGTGREVEVKRDAKETIVASNGRLYNKATGGSREGCDIGSVQSAIKDDTLCSHYGRNIGRRSSKIVLRQHVEAARAARKRSVG